MEQAPALNGATAWMASVLLGPVSVAIAVLAVAVLGVLMLEGRIPVRRGSGVVLGCFILFSANQISSGLVEGRVLDQGEVPAEPVPAASYVPVVPEPAPYDPYAGAALPGRGRMSIEQPLVQ